MLRPRGAPGVVDFGLLAERYWRELAFPAMIFDPALAAAARRHQRAKNKAQKSPPDAENTGSISSNSASNNNSTSSSAAPAGKVAAEETTNPDGGGPASAAAASAAESGEHGGSAEAKEVRAEEKAGSSGSVGDDGSAGGAGAAAAGTRSRTTSGSSNGVDFEGATARVRAGGGGASRQRPMKPRVLLKIVVLGCSNVRIVLRWYCCGPAECLVVLCFLRYVRSSIVLDSRTFHRVRTQRTAAGTCLSPLPAQARHGLAVTAVMLRGWCSLRWAGARD